MTTDLARRPTTTPRAPAMEHDAAMALAATEYHRVGELFASLAPHQLGLPTDCPGWDVRALAGHMLGMAQMAASLPEMVVQQVRSGRGAKRSGEKPIDALTALQVRKNAHLTPEELVEAMRAAGRAAARSRSRVPAVLRRRTLPQPQDVGAQRELWTVGYLFDVILTRDPFMHRSDIARATGEPMQVTAEHEGVLVDDVVREWAGRHRQAYQLRLSGPAGGTWGNGDAPPISMDAIDFCRAVSGRGPAFGLLATAVPF